MAFDLATAKPVQGGFDLSTAKPVTAGDDPTRPPGSGPKVENAPPTSAMEFVKGIPAAVVGAGQGLTADIAGRVAALIPGVDPKTAVALKQKMQPNVSERGQETLRVLGHAAEATGIDKLAGMGPMAMPGGAATNLAKPAAKQVGRAVATDVDALKRIPGKVADVVTPTPSKEIAALAKKAEDMGIQLRPDMLSNNRYAKMFGEVMEQVPLSGSKAEQRQIAFNRALTNIIGGDKRSERITPLVFDEAMTKSGEKIGQIAKQTPIPLDGELQSTLAARVQHVQQFETSDVAKVISNYVAELNKKAVNGVVPGETFRKINSQIGKQIRSTSNGDLKNALYELQEDMHSALERNIASPERLAELKDARLKYAMGKIIEPMVAKSASGDVSPQALMQAVTSDGAKKTMMARGRGGEIGDLARIGQAFLKEPPSSGSGERIGALKILKEGVTGGVVGGGLVAEPMTAAITAANLYGLANLYNRAGPALTKRAVARRSVDPAEAQIWNTDQLWDRLTK